MSEWLSQTDYINSIAKELLKPRQEYYSEDTFQIRINQHPLLHLRHLKTYNSFHQQLYAILIDKRQQISEYCIVYMHGMGSNTLEASPLVDLLPDNVALCCFDFSASGKSQGSCSTYGIKEHLDIGYIIKLLKKEGYKKFILWGRSMGAFASLAFTSIDAYRSDCILQIVDSAFSNFQSVCRQRARHQFGMPQFLLSYGVNLMKKNLSEHPFNPFSFNLIDKLKACRIPTIFVYNQKDEVVPSDNTEDLIKEISKNCTYERIIIEDPHNCMRSQLTLNRIMTKLRKHILTPVYRQAVTHKRKALNVCSTYFNSGSSKNLSIPTEMETGRVNRRTALFCSLSKQLNVSQKRGIKYS